MSQNNSSIQFPSGSGEPVMQEDVLEAMMSHPRWRLINKLLLRKNKSVPDLQKHSEQMIEWVLQVAINDVLPAMAIYQLHCPGQDTSSSSRSTSSCSIMSNSPSSTQSRDQASPQGSAKPDVPPKDWTDFNRSIEEDIPATMRDTDSKEAIVEELFYSVIEKDAEEKTRALADILTEDVHEQIPQRPQLAANTNTSKAVFHWHKREVELQDTNDQLFFQVYKLLLKGRLALTRRCHSQTDLQNLQAKQHLDWELFTPLLSSFIRMALEKLLKHYLGLARSLPDLHVLVSNLINWPCRMDMTGSSSDSSDGTSLGGSCPVPGPSRRVGRKRQTSSVSQDQRRALEAMTEVLTTEVRGALHFVCNDKEQLRVIVIKGLHAADRTQVDDISNSSSDVCQAKQDAHEEEMSESFKSLNILMETQMLSLSPFEAWTSSEPSDLWASTGLEKAVSSSPLDDRPEMGSSQQDLKKTKPSGLLKWFALIRKNNKVGPMVTVNTAGSGKELMTKAEQEIILVTVLDSSEKSSSVSKMLKKEKRSIKGLFQRMSAALSKACSCSCMSSQ